MEPMVVTKQELLAALDAVSFGLGKQGFIEGAEHITFDEGHLWTFNGDIGGRAPCPEPLSKLKGAIDGQKFLHFTTKAPGERMRFKLEEGKDKIEIKSGRAKIVLDWIREPQEFPYSIPKKWFSVPEDFAEGLALSSVCCAIHLTRPLLTCIHIRTDRIEGTDGMRALHYIFKKPLPKEVSALVPKYAALIAAKLVGLKSMAVQKERSAWFKTEGGDCVFCPIMSGDYPDLLEKLQPAKGKDSIQFSLPLHDLDPILDRAKVFCGEDVAEGENYVDVYVKDQLLYVEASDDHSKYIETIRLKKKVPDLSIILNTQHLLDLVKQKQKTKCVLSKELGRLWIQAKKWNYVSLVRTSGSE